MAYFYGDVLSVVRNLGGTKEAVYFTKDGLMLISTVDVDANFQWFYVNSGIPGVQSKSLLSSNK